MCVVYVVFWIVNIINNFLKFGNCFFKSKKIIGLVSFKEYLGDLLVMLFSYVRRS